MGALFFIHILTRRKKEYANIKINKKKSERCTHTHTGKHMTSTQIQITWPHMPDAPRPLARLTPTVKGDEERKIFGHTLSLAPKVKLT